MKDQPKTRVEKWLNKYPSLVEATQDVPVMPNFDGIRSVQGSFAAYKTQTKQHRLGMLAYGAHRIALSAQDDDWEDEAAFYLDFSECFFAASRVGLAKSVLARHRAKKPTYWSDAKWLKHCKGCEKANDDLVVYGGIFEKEAEDIREKYFDDSQEQVPSESSDE